MWLYVAYTLRKFWDKLQRYEFSFLELEEFFFERLWEAGKVVLHNGIIDLYYDLDYLAKIDAILFDFRGFSLAERKRSKVRIKNIVQLDFIAKVVESRDWEITKRYLEAINKAIEGMKNG